MQKFKKVIATSEVDLDGEMIPRESLERMAHAANGQYIPVGWQHDPRVPPLGRTVSAEVVRREDGVYQLQTIMEIFEPGDKIEYQDDGREIPLILFDPGSLHVAYDRSYRDSESQQLVASVAGLFGTPPKEEMKKSMDPISVLTIGGAFVLGGIFSGFLSALGEDLYSSLKSKLKQIFQREKLPEQERLLVFEFNVHSEAHLINVQVILTDPSDTDLEQFFIDGLKQLDNLTCTFRDPLSCVREVVCQFAHGKVSFLHGVRKDCVPLSFREAATVVDGDPLDSG